MIIVSDKILKIFSFILGGMPIRGLAFFPFIFLASNANPDEYLINHERIHLRQQLELLIIPFYIWYLIEYFTKGYMSTSFEKEAYANEKDLNYLKKRKLFGFIKYL